MKKAFLFFVLFLSSLVFSQTEETFDQVKARVSKIYFNTPEKAKGDVYKLQKLAKTDLQRIFAIQYLGYLYDLTGKPDSARVYLQERLYLTKKKIPEIWTLLPSSN